MKNALSIVGQFLLFFIADAIGSLFYHPFGIVSSVPGANQTARSFQWDGLITMAVVYMIILVIAALRKRLRTAAPWSSLAVLLAALAGYLLKLGFITQKW